MFVAFTRSQLFRVPAVFGGVDLVPAGSRPNGQVVDEQHIRPGGMVCMHILDRRKTHPIDRTMGDQKWTGTKRGVYPVIVRAWLAR